MQARCRGEAQEERFLTAGDWDVNIWVVSNDTMLAKAENDGSITGKASTV